MVVLMEINTSHVKQAINDQREQLFNEGASGQFSEVQVSRERVAQLRGIMFDIDMRMLNASPLITEPAVAPADFYHRDVQNWLGRNPVLSKAEVRCSGQGLHVILRFDKPVEFRTDGDRDRWDGIVKVVQAALPVDPDAPSITATTRPIGSTNSKNGATVTLLTPGSQVSQEEVLSLYEAMKDAPFETVLGILAGPGEIKPCPFCQGAGTKVNPGRIVGFCYGGCGKISMPTLYELLLSPRHVGEQEGAGHDQSL